MFEYRVQWAWGVAACCGLALLMAIPVVGQTSRPSASEERLLESIAADLGEGIIFSLNGKHLAVTVPASGNEFRGVTAKANFGNRQRSSSSSGGNYWRIYSSGDRAQLTAEAGQPGVRADAGAAVRFRLIAQEFITPPRLLSLNLLENDLDLVVLTPGDGSVLQLSQSAQYGAALQWIDSEGVVALFGSSLVELASDNEEVFDRLGSWLTRIGLKLPPLSVMRLTQDIGLRCMQLERGNWDHVKERFAALDAPTFQSREQATRELAESFSEWETAIILALTKEEIYGETRTRLTRILEEQASPSVKVVANNMIRDELFSDAKFLLTLATIAADDLDRAFLVRRLSEVTGQMFGDDLPAWSEWLAESEVESPRPAQNTRPTIPPAHSRLDRARVELSRLLALTTNDDRLVLNRLAWREPFGNRSAAEIFDQLQEDIQRANIPGRWTNLGADYELSFVDLPHLLFEHFDEATHRSLPGDPEITFRLNTDPQSRPAKKTEWNRNVSTDWFDAQLQFPDTQPPHLAPDAAFQFSLAEKQIHGVRLQLMELPSGEFHLALSHPQRNTLLLMVQTPGQPARLAFTIGDQAFDWRDDSIPALFHTHRDLIVEYLWPTLASHGVNLSEALGGPLPIVNQD